MFDQTLLSFRTLIFSYLPIAVLRVGLLSVLPQTLVPLISLSVWASKTWEGSTVLGSGLQPHVCL